MKSFILILFYGLILFSCRSVKDTTNKSLVFLTLEKTNCKGHCPVFSLSIYENGSVYYSGTKNVDKIGNYKKTLSKSEIKDLKKAFLNADFFSFENKYTEKITDLPTTYISFTYKRQTKRIVDYYGAPKKLKELEEILEKISNCNDDWEKLD